MTKEPMSVKEAIGLCKCAAEDMDLQEMPRFAQAVRLGREALIRLQDLRSNPFLTRCAMPLPGETEQDPPEQ